MQELENAKPGDMVARVLGEAQERHQVLDVRGFEKLQPAIFDEGDVAPRQLDLERPAVMRGAEEHRLRLEQVARLAVGEHAVDDVARLVALGRHGDELRQQR